MPVAKRKRVEVSETADVEEEIVANENAESFKGTGAELAQSLQSRSIDANRQALLHLRRSTALNGHDERPSSADRRIVFALQFLETDFGLEHSGENSKLFTVWDTFQNQNQVSLLPLPLFALSNLIALLGVHQPNHAYADRLISSLLPTGKSKEEDCVHEIKINRYWANMQLYLSNASGKKAVQGMPNSQSSEILVMATIRLLLEMNNFAGGKYSKAIFDNMNWTMKSIPRLLNMRGRAKTKKMERKMSTKDTKAVTLDRPDVRTLWLLFLLSFLQLNTGILQPTSIQLSILSLGKDILPAILKGLRDDSSQVVIFVLMALHKSLLSDESDSRLPRSRIVSFFNEWACKELLGLYDRESDLISVAGTAGERHSIADIVHHFMLALCTHPGRGICYTDQGWYGREVSNHETEKDTEDSDFHIYNKINFGLLKSLSPTRSFKQAELSLRILNSSQELIAPYFTQSLGTFSSSSLEPRGAAIGWLSTIAFMCRVFSIPLPDQTRWKTSPPSYDRCIASLLPAGLSRGLLQRCIQHKDALTRHSALILLSRILERLSAFKTICQSMSIRGSDPNSEYVSKDSNINHDHGTEWMTLMQEFLDEVKNRVPDLGTIIGTFQRQFTAKVSPPPHVEAQSNSHSNCSILIAEASLRAAKCHFHLFTDANPHEISLLLSEFSVGSNKSDDAEHYAVSLINQIHAIQLLTSIAKVNPGGFDLNTKQASKSITPLRSQLSLARKSVLDQVRSISWELVAAGMLDTILFEHDQDEWVIWQYALKYSSEEMLDLFDECVQRCLKTPYRYLEMARDEWLKSGRDGHISPLFYTIKEQYFIRLQSGIFDTQEKRLSFPQFLILFMPALHAFHSEDVTKSKTPCTVFINLLLERLHEALDQIKDHQNQVSSGSDKYWPDLEDINEIKELFDIAQEVTLNLINPISKSKEVLKAKNNGKTASFGVLTNPTDATLSKIDAVTRFASSCNNGISLLLRNHSHDVIDWEGLQTSPIQTKILLIYDRNSIIKKSRSFNEIEFSLRLILHHGHAATVNTLSTFFRDKALIAQCTQSIELTQLLMGSLIQSPIPIEELKTILSTPNSLMSSALHHSYGICQDVIESSSKTLLREILVQFFDLLDEDEQLQVWDQEDDVNLLCAIGLSLPLGLRWRNKSRWEYLLNSLLTSQNLEKGLLILKELSNNSEIFSWSKLEVLQVDYMKTILSRSNARIHDLALRSLLRCSSRSCVHFWKEVENTITDDLEIFSRLPLTMMEAMTQFGNQLDMLETSIISDWRDSIEYLIKRKYEILLSEDKVIATSFAQFLVEAYHVVHFEPKTISDLLMAKLPSRPANLFRQSILLHAHHLCVLYKGSWIKTEYMTSLIDMSLLWLVRRFAEDEKEDEETTKCLEVLLSMLTKCTSEIILKPHLVNPVISAATSNRHESLLHLHFIATLIQSTAMKKTNLEEILAELIGKRDVISCSDKRKVVIGIVYNAIANDESLCQEGLITSSVKLYNGTLSEADRKLLLIYQKYESLHGVSLYSILNQHWKLDSITTNDVNLGLLSRLDHSQVHETSLRFPRCRGFEDMIASGYAKDVTHSNEDIYDPLIILSILAEFISSLNPISGLHWLQLIRTNTLGVVVCSLSSKMSTMRIVAKSILVKIYMSVQSAQFQEKDQLVLILDYVRNCYTNKGSDEEQPLPLTTTLFVSYCLRSLGTPSLYLYPLISRFLLQRPLPDPTDIPLLYNLLYSSTAQSTTSKAEKMFILRYIFICIKYGGKGEWNILKRRHVWDSICTMYASQDVDISLKRVIEDIFFAITCKSDLGFRVVTRYGFMSFLGQVLTMMQDTSQDAKEHTRSVIVACTANLLEHIDLHRLKRATGPSYIISFSNLLGQTGVFSRKIKLVELLHDALRCIKQLHLRDIKVDLANIRESLDALWLSEGEGSARRTTLEKCKKSLESINQSSMQVVGNRAIKTGRHSSLFSSLHENHEDNEEVIIAN